MRKSGVGFLNLSSISIDEEAVYDLDQKHETFATCCKSLVLVIRHQLELLDDLEITGSKATNNSFLHKIVAEIVGFNSCYLQSQTAYFEQAVAVSIKKGEVDFRDGMFFSKRGGRKTNIEEKSVRRMSFAATNYCDNTEILRLEKLKEMTDLEFLFSLNGYHLPYANSTSRRSMYESFFSVFINEVSTIANQSAAPSGEDESPEAETAAAYLFALLQESIYMLHSVTEYTVSIAECIFEMMSWVNPRLKSIPMSINLRLPTYTGASTPLFEHLTSCFTDENKIFSQFTKKRLITAINERGKDEILDWKGRLDNYAHSLGDGLELYQSGCERFIESIRAYRKRWCLRSITVGRSAGGIESQSEVYRPDIEIYLTDVELYLDQTRRFILLLTEEQSVYRQFYRSAINLLDALNAVQEKYPIKYGGTVTPRNQKSPRSPKGALARSQGGSSSGSPRTGSDLESPATDLAERARSTETKRGLSRFSSFSSLTALFSPPK